MSYVPNITYLLHPGWIYRFKFVTMFSTYDGTYKVQRIYTYPELLKDNVDLYESLYAKLNIPRTDFEVDVVTYIKENIYKLENTEDEDDVIYAPQSILQTIPVYNVQKYSEIAIAFHLGIFKTGEEVSYLMSNISEAIAASLGVEQQPRAIVTNKHYLTDSEYEEIEKLRKNTMSKVLNYFSENVRLEEEVQSLKQRNKVLEDYIKNISIKKTLS